MKRKRWNPVHKHSEQGETRNRPATILTKKEKIKRGKIKYRKQYLEALEDQ